MASEALFQALAEALGKPSKTYQALETGFKIPTAAMEGYNEGADFRDKIAARDLQRKTLSDALGGSLPAGLEGFGNTTVAGATALERPITAIAALDKARRGSINSTSYTPEQVKAIFSGDPEQISTAFNGQVPSGAVSPALGVVREANKESQFVRGKNAAEGAKVGENVSRVGQLKTMISQLEPLVSQNNPIPGLGNIEGAIYSRTGGKGTPQMARSADINNIAAPLSAALNYELTKRFNAGESQLIQKALAPNGNDSPQYGLNKLQKMKSLVGAMESGNEQSIRNMASAITGGSIDTNAPVTTDLNMGKSGKNSDPLGLFK